MVVRISLCKSLVKEYQTALFIALLLKKQNRVTVVNNKMKF